MEEEKNNNNISKNIEDFECLACHKIKQRRCNNQSKRLPKGVMRLGATTCSTNCRKKARDMRYTKPNSSNLNNTSCECEIINGSKIQGNNCSQFHGKVTK